MRVALRKESVDRNNSLESKQIDPSVVALRKESVDRNHYEGNTSDTYPVALRKESVDRNILFLIFFIMIIMSLSARRAWIEIC